MLHERGVTVDHSTISRWVQKYALLMEKRLRWHWKHKSGTSWQVDTDKAPPFNGAIEELKMEGKWPEDFEHRRVKYLNYRIEADHRKPKRLINLVRGFKSMKTAYTQSEGQEALPPSKVLKSCVCLRTANLKYGCMEIRFVNRQLLWNRLG